MYLLTHDSLSFKGKPSGNSQLTGESAQGSDESGLKNYCFTSTIVNAFVFAHTWKSMMTQLSMLTYRCAGFESVAGLRKISLNHTSANARSQDRKLPVLYVFFSFCPLCVELGAWCWLDSLESSPLRWLHHREPRPLSCCKSQSRFNKALRFRVAHEALSYQQCGLVSPLRDGCALPGRRTGIRGVLLATTAYFMLPCTAFCYIPHAAF